ncbi:MAG: EamA family transporter [Herbiconiux sp.]|uniref:DMT family transporter n=1 Tax=Herbiconiux sp. TaxID=1871186 RepID=UPI0011F8A7DC|nr:EamA family transporter [Herbiconiux sp.]TAJ49837.1 MAG: EamA family transporter [Herbiconiux sp.]
MLPYLAVVLAAVCFGTTGTAQAFGPVDASAGSVGAARILIGGGLLALTALALRLRAARSSAETSYSAPERAPRYGFRRLGGWPIVVGALGVVAYQPLFFLGVSVNGVAVGTVVALGSAPVITGVIDWAIRRRFPGAVWLVATAIAMVGVALISGVLAPGAADAAAGTASAISLPGLAASIGAGASYAVYTLASKALLERGWTASGTMGSVFGLAALLSIPLLLATDTRWLFTGPGLALALWLGVITTTVAYLLFGWGLARLPASTVSTLTLTEPLTATLLGTLVLGETLTAMAAVGLAVLAVGLVVLAAPRRPLRPVARLSGGAASR